MSVLGNTKSKSHRKAHHVEPDDTGRKFMRLTRGDLPSESVGEVSRGRSSEESRRKAEGAKGRRTKREQSTDRLRLGRHGDIRNGAGAATAAATRLCGCGAGWWNPPGTLGVGVESLAVRKEVAEDAQ